MDRKDGKTTEELAELDRALMRGSGKVLDRLRDKIQAMPDVGCWNWQRKGRNRGYGMMWWKRRLHLSHRIAWYETTGTEPDGVLEIHHICENPACVRPSHLEEVTGKENRNRSKKWRGRAVATRCIHGHPMDGRYKTGAEAGKRYCKACNRESCRRRYRAKKSRAA
jgi:hypothetical protein